LYLVEFAFLFVYSTRPVGKTVELFTCINTCPPFIILVFYYSFLMSCYKLHSKFIIFWATNLWGFADGMLPVFYLIMDSTLNKFSLFKMWKSSELMLIFLMCPSDLKFPTSLLMSFESPTSVGFGLIIFFVLYRSKDLLLALNFGLSFLSSIFAIFT